MALQSFTDFLYERSRLYARKRYVGFVKTPNRDDIIFMTEYDTQNNSFVLDQGEKEVSTFPRLLFDQVSGEIVAINNEALFFRVFLEITKNKCATIQGSKSDLKSR